MSTGNFLHKLFGEKSPVMHVFILDWTYKVSASSPRGTPGVLFQWEGVTRTISNQKISVIGEFIIVDDAMQTEWSGSPFETGKARLSTGRVEADKSISVDIRVNDKCCEQIWRAFVLGQGSHDCGGVAVRVKFGSPSEDERYKDPERLPVREFLVISGGNFQDISETR